MYRATHIMDSIIINNSITGTQTDDQLVSKPQDPNLSLADQPPMGSDIPLEKISAKEEQNILEQKDIATSAEPDTEEVLGKG